MEKVLYLFLHLGIPAFIVVSLQWMKPKSTLALTTGVLARVIPLCFLYLWGQYPLTGSFYLRYLLPVIILVVIAQAWKSRSRSNRAVQISTKGYLALLPGILIIMVSTWLAVSSMIGLIIEPKVEQDLVFPLQGGAYYISSGGNTKVINNHFRNFPNSQQYAIDINQLNVWGGAMSPPFSSSSASHEIFGADVYCPCEGEVVDLMNNVSDNANSSMEVNHDNGRGNYLDIRCDDIIVSLSHLQEGSVLPEIGDTLLPHEIIAKVGNSGFSQEPHLHIQAARYDKDSVLVGIAVSYDKAWLVRNNVVRE